MRIDIYKIAHQYRMSKDAVMNILGLFISSTEKDFNALNEALKSNSIIETRRIVHKLKSSYAYIMINDSVELCDHIKHEAERSNNIDSIKPYISKIVEIHSELLIEIRKLK